MENQIKVENMDDCCEEPEIEFFPFGGGNGFLISEENKDPLDLGNNGNDIESKEMVVWKEEAVGRCTSNIVCHVNVSNKSFVNGDALKNTSICEKSYSSNFQNDIVKCETFQEEVNSIKTEFVKEFDSEFSKKTIECNCCNKTFMNVSRLNRHMKEHTSVRAFSCDVCKKSFFLRCHLKEHMRVHSGEKPFVCEICKKSYTIPSRLKEHMTKHTGEKPFVCNICQKSFASNRYLTQHMLIHSGEKPYVCNVCELLFNQPSHLKSHMLVHTGEKPFMCDVCGESFPRSGSYKNHMRKHSQEK